MGYSAFGIFGGMFALVFVVVAGIIISVVIRSVDTWNKNNNSPRLTVPATVAAKRTKVFHQKHANAGDISGAHGYHTTTSKSYYATFQVESGDRMELSVSGSEYGMLTEGDEGNLSFQGTRYLGFERTV